MESELHIEFITYKEGEQIVAYAPHLKLCFNSRTEAGAIDTLKVGTRMLLDFWKEKNSLKEKIESLALNGASKQLKENVAHAISVPYYVLKNDYQTKEFTISIEE